MEPLRLLPLAILGTALFATLAYADDSEDAWNSRGELGLESRAFRDDGNGLTQDYGVGMFGRLELRHRHGALQEKARGFGRLDTFDRQRTTLIGEEVWAQAESERFRVRLGLDIVNWSAMEAFHPADVINARNLDSDLENLEKIGEPMAALQVRVREGTSVNAMFMPVYMKTLFPSPRSRLNFGPPGVDLRGARLLIDRDGALVDGGLGSQAALQVRQVVGSADVAIHALEHMDRLQPVALVDPVTGEVRLLFQTARQIGGTYQQVFGPVIAKLEGTYRWFAPAGAAATTSVGPLPDRSHGSVAAGLEYGLAHGRGGVSTFFAEGTAILGVDANTRRALTPFQRDVFVGWRFARNDEAGKELVVAAIVDLERAGEYLISAGYRQRIGETWTVALGLRVFQARPVAAAPAAGLDRFGNGDHVRLALTRHF